MLYFHHLLNLNYYPLLAVYFNAGRLGEYLTYKYLRKYEQQGAKFLFNVYVPKANGETSEIDVMMIYSKGLFVFESKNYSGWIFGNETQKMWTQTLPAGRGRSHKESFYNPIMQNKSHINHLLAFLGETVPTKSIIVFSERCTLKKVEVKSDDIYVIKRNHVAETVSKICNSISNELLNDANILGIYNRLYPYTQVNDTIKEQHIINIQKQHITTVSTESTTEKQLFVKVEIPSVDEETSEKIHNTGNEIPSEPPSDISPSESSINVKQTNATNTPLVTTGATTPTCPRCGSKMILRTASKGANKGRQFYGCSNYPKCRYIKNE